VHLDHGHYLSMICPSPLDDVSYHGPSRIWVPPTLFHVVHMIASRSMEYIVSRSPVRLHCSHTFPLCISFPTFRQWLACTTKSSMFSLRCNSGHGCTLIMGIICPSPLDDVSYHGPSRIWVPPTPFHVVHMFASRSMEYIVSRSPVRLHCSHTFPLCISFPTIVHGSP